MRRNSSSLSDDMEGPRHAGSAKVNAYAGERFVAQHLRGTLLSTRGVILRLSVTGSTDKLFLTCAFGTIFTTLGGL
jgi:hypothetical protein